MPTCIPDFIATVPDVDVFLSLEPEELGDLILLKAAESSMQNGIFCAGDISHNEQWDFVASYDFQYKQDYKAHAGMIKAQYKF